MRLHQSFPFHLIRVPHCNCKELVNRFAKVSSFVFGEDQKFLIFLVKCILFFFFICWNKKQIHIPRDDNIIHAICSISKLNPLICLLLPSKLKSLDTLTLIRTHIYAYPQELFWPKYAYILVLFNYRFLFFFKKINCVVSGFMSTFKSVYLLIYFYFQKKLVS